MKKKPLFDKLKEHIVLEVVGIILVGALIFIGTTAYATVQKSNDNEKTIILLQENRIQSDKRIEEFTKAFGSKLDKVGEEVNETKVDVGAMKADIRNIAEAVKILLEK